MANTTHSNVRSRIGLIRVAAVLLVLATACARTGLKAVSADSVPTATTTTTIESQQSLPDGGTLPDSDMLPPLGDTIVTPGEPTSPPFTSPGDSPGSGDPPSGESGPAGPSSGLPSGSSQPPGGPSAPPNLTPNPDAPSSTAAPTNQEVPSGSEAPSGPEGPSSQGVPTTPPGGPTTQTTAPNNPTAPTTTTTITTTATTTTTTTLPDQAPVALCGDLTLSVAGIFQTYDYWLSSDCFSDPEGGPLQVSSTQGTFGSVTAPTNEYCGALAGNSWCWQYTPQGWGGAAYWDSFNIWAEDAAGNQSTSIRIDLCLNC